MKKVASSAVLASILCSLSLQTSLGAAPGSVDKHEGLKPIGEGKGIHPGRVVWVHDTQAVEWKGPGDGHWYQDGHSDQSRLDQMMQRALTGLTGETTPATAWDKLFRHFNRGRGKGDVGYAPGEKLLIKPNWVGMIWHEGAVDAETYTLTKRQDYMNTSPQMIIALLRQLVGVVGIEQKNITVSDTLSYLVNEYYEILHREFPQVQYEDFAGKFGRTKVKASTVPLYWSCRPEAKKQDYLPTCIAVNAGFF